MLLIYTPKITARIRYVFSFLFRDMLACEYQLTESVEDFLNYRSARFSYGDKPLGSEIFFKSSGLLQEHGLREIHVNYLYSKGLHGLFPVEGGEMNFDPFGATFYLLSRYEEYFPFLSDVHGRFEARQSIAWRHGFLKIPVVDTYALRIFEILATAFPGELSAKRAFTFLPTFDIDIAYAFRNRGMVRTLAGMGRSIFSKQWNDLIRRIRVLGGWEKDPYDTYDVIFFYHEESATRPVFFFLLGDYGRFDKNLPYGNPDYQSLIKALADYSPVGIHPSYNSSKVSGRLQEETERLSQIIRRPVTRSRQHFLKMKLPHTYRDLLQADIKEDFTMGYASMPGFRAGTCTPFYFYDLDLEIQTRLKVYPFAVMDGALHDYLKLTPQEAKLVVEEIIKEVKNVKGCFISLWHNESLSEWKAWTGWREVYSHLVEKASSD